ncbi:unnamed protein product [Candidula unifasciata]|uniref:Uncharacterized protein n=1 Tax=Candidula unifasciata TaxID=100452 RepID=A0A8S3ZZD5_9EUPU|nr:unnamed protein product [Candidula unifasciata]
MNRSTSRISLSYIAAQATMSVWTSSVFFLLVLFLMRVNPSTAPGECGGVSTKVLDFLATFSGRYSNCKQKAEGHYEYDLVQSKIIPLELPSLSQEPFLYLEQATNGRVNILALVTVTEDKDGILFMTPHIFTNGTQFKFEEYKIESLSSLKPGDIQTYEACKAAVQPLENGDYLINFPDCSTNIKGHNPSYSIVTSCEVAYIIMPAGGPIKPVPVPYRMQRFGSRFPVPGADSDYVNPCKRK